MSESGAGGSSGADADEGREVESEPFEYRLTVHADGRHVLGVLANQSAFYYFKCHTLSPEECERYRSQGKPFLARLARRVRYDRDAEG